MFEVSPPTPSKFNIAPEKWWLEDYFPIGKATFLGAMLNFMRVVVVNVSLTSAFLENLMGPSLAAQDTGRKGVKT